MLHFRHAPARWLLAASMIAFAKGLGAAAEWEDRPRLVRADRKPHSARRDRRRQGSS